MGENFRQQWNKSRGVQYPTFNNKQMINVENQYETMDLNDTLDIYTTFHSTAAEGIFLSAHEHPR